MGWPTDVRMLGARLYDQARQNAYVAGQKLTSLLKGNAPAEPGQFCKRWFKHYKQRGHVQDAPRSGRPRRVPDTLARDIAKRIIGNPSTTEPPTYYYSLRHFLHKNPDIQAQVATLGVTNRTIERSLRRADPSIRRRRPGRKKVLNPKQKKARRSIASILKRCPMYQLRSTVFVDEATLVLERAPNPLVYAQAGVPLPPDQDEHAGTRAKFKVHYIGAVMDGVGNVGMFKLTGTTGVICTYTVSPPLANVHRPYVYRRCSTKPLREGQAAMPTHTVTRCRLFTISGNLSQLPHKGLSVL